MPPGRPDGEGDAPLELASQLAQDADSHQPGAQPAPWLAEPSAAVQLYRAEITEPPRDGARAAPLLHAIGDLQQNALHDEGAAQRSYQDALAADASFVAPLLPLRRLLAAQGQWQALLTLLDQSLQNPSLSTADKADLWVERGRLLEDRFQRDDDAAASYRSVLGSPDAPTDHPPALLSLLLLASRTGDGAGVETALTGLARLATSSALRAAVLVELVEAQRALSDDGEGRALRTLSEAMVSPVAAPGLALWLRQLDALTRARDPRVRSAALGDLARRALAIEPPVPALAAALLREQGRLFRDQLSDPLAAFASFREALQLQPAHPVLAGELCDIADQLNRADLLDDVLDLSPEAIDGAPNPVRREIVLRHAEVLARLGQSADAVGLLQIHPALATSDPRVQVVELVLRARAGDGPALAAAFESEGERLTGVAAAKAFLRAAAVAEWVLGQGDRAETLMRTALARAPGYRPAVEALAGKLRPAGRAGELGSLFEGEMESLASAPGGDVGRRVALLESLVVLYRDELREPARGAHHQRQLVTLAGDDAAAATRALVRLLDLELLLVATRPPGAPVGEARGIVDTLLALAASVAQPTLAAALRTEAARVLSARAAGDDDRRRAEALYRQALAAAPDGLAAAGLEQLLAQPGFPAPDRARRLTDALAVELTGAEAGGRTAEARSLRFRLAQAQARAENGQGGVAALETLRPLRAAGDRLAHQISVDLARASGRLDWEVAVLTEAWSAQRDDQRSPALALELAEAVEREGDVRAAATRFQTALASAPTLDAALGLLRCAVASPGAAASELVTALQALGKLSGDQPALAATLQREAAFVAAAAGMAPMPAATPVAPSAVDAGGRSTPGPETGAEIEAIDRALGRWMAGARDNDPTAIADGLFQLVRAAGERAGNLVPVLARAAARARLGPPDDARRIQMLAWREFPDAPALQQGLTDLAMAAPPGVELIGLAAARASRAASAGALKQSLDLERAVDAELGGRLGEALTAYGRVLARDPESLDAIEGVRRLAQAAGDAVGEARALGRLGTLVKGPMSAPLFAEAARLYESVGQREQAIALHWHVLEERPDDPTAIHRLGDHHADDLDGPGRAQGLDRLLSHRLSLLPHDHADRVPLLLARARNRLSRQGDSAQAINDLKRILKIVPYHEEALGELSALAIAQPSPGDAIRLLERYVAVVREPGRAGQARLDLAGAYEAVGDAGRAVEILEQAATASPDDERPRARVVDLLLRAGDWRGALAALRAWDQATSDSRTKAQLYLRIGTLLRDRALDQGGAAQSFRLAADLDPLGDGARALVSLHESLGDGAGRATVIAHEIGNLRQGLAVDPLDVARLHRLKEFLDRDAVVTTTPVTGTPIAGVSAAHALGDATAPVCQVLGLLGEIPEPAGPLAVVRRMGAGLSGAAFWTRLALPASAGFLTEIWALIAAAVGEVHRLSPEAVARLGLSRQTRLAPGSEARVSWVEATAAALGIEGLSLYASAQPLGEQGDASVVAAELPDPVLVFDRAALAGGAAARFRLGRALALFRLRATVLDRLSGEELRQVFLAAAALAGAPVTASAAPAAVVKALGKALPRKDRKALTLQASRFGFEASDVEGWRQAVLSTADRLGLIAAGDVAAAVRTIAHAHGPLATVAQLQASPAALELLRFALQPDYLDLRAEAGVAGS